MTRPTELTRPAAVPPWRRPEAVVATRLASGEGVLVHLGTMATYRLNETAMEIWLAAGRGEGEGAISRRLERRFEVAAKACRRDVADTLAWLAEERLLAAAE